MDEAEAALCDRGRADLSEEAISALNAFLFHTSDPVLHLHARAQRRIDPGDLDAAVPDASTRPWRSRCRTRARASYCTCTRDGVRSPRAFHETGPFVRMALKRFRAGRALHWIGRRPSRAGEEDGGLFPAASVGARDVKWVQGAASTTERARPASSCSTTNCGIAWCAGSSRR